jgi:hypothetical protein
VLNDLAVGDLNGDGRPDVVTANTVVPGSSVSVLMGRGSGFFTSRVDLPTNITATCVALADLDGDGRLDLMVGGGGAEGAQWRRGNGDGTFGSALPIATGYAASSIAAGDLDGDGIPDLAIASDWPTGSIRILRGLGGGAFATPIVRSYGTQGRSIRIADLDGDGRPDVYTADGSALLPSTYWGTLAFVQNSGGGAFAATNEILIPNSIGIFDAVLADINADGKPDLLAYDYSRGRFYTSIATGGGAFAPPAILFGLGMGENESSITSADLDGNGTADVVIGIAYYSTGRISILLGNGDGTFKPRIDVAFPRPYSVRVADMNDDGKPDLVVGGDGVTILLGNGDGAFGASPWTPLKPATLPEAMQVASDPLVGECRIELAMAVAAPAQVGVYDVAGRRLVTLANGVMPAGSQELRWDGRDAQGARVPAGIYFVRLLAAHEQVVARVAFTR